MAIPQTMTDSHLVQSRILIVDDDRELCSLLGDYLRQQGFEVHALHDADTALSQLAAGAEPPDLLILDVMMPGIDGLTALRTLRQQHSLPVLMLSARGEPVDRVIGLEQGADDYLAKPCLPRELLARVKALLRRQPPVRQDEPLSVGQLKIEPATRTASLDGQLLRLTAAEYGVLLTLAQHAGKPVDKATLTQQGLGRPLERFDRSVDVHVSRLRHKLAEPGSVAPVIESVRGVGYVLLDREQA
jgi:two-component system response regulator CpxR